jgi:hypothetical protein
MNEEMNRYVAEKLGYPKICRGCQMAQADSKMLDRGGRCFHVSYPDFSNDPGAVQLLRLMMGRKDWWVFRNKYGDEHRYNEQSGEYDYEPMIPINLITTPSALLKACYAWFKEGEK